MSGRRLTASIVRGMGLPRAPQAVLLEIVRFAGGRQVCSISQDDLADRLKVSRKTVTRAMICLRELGLIQTDRTSQKLGRHRGCRGADIITLCENAWSIVPTSTLRQRDMVSPWVGSDKGSECPFEQRDKMSQQLEYTSKGGDRDHESGRREGDGGPNEDHRRAPANDVGKLRLLPGGRAA